MIKNGSSRLAEAHALTRISWWDIYQHLRQIAAVEFDLVIFGWFFSRRRSHRAHEIIEWSAQTVCRWIETIDEFGENKHTHQMQEMNLWSALEKQITMIGTIDRLLLSSCRFDQIILFAFFFLLALFCLLILVRTASIYQTKNKKKKRFQFFMLVQFDRFFLSSILFYFECWRIIAQSD